MKKRQQLFVAMLAILAVLLSSGMVEAQTGTRGRSNFDWIIARRITVSTLGIAVTGGVVSDDVTASDDLVVTDDAILASDLTLTPQSVITLTMNATLSPTGSYQQLASAGTVNTSSITAGTAGDVLTLVNTTNTSIVFTDTGTLKLTGNLTLGQYDSVVLVSDGTNWVMLSTSNN